MSQILINFDADRDLTIQERFERFHKENPHVYEVLLDLATEARKKGASKLGIGMLWEVMRWRVWMATSDPSGLKLNDHYRSRYVRMLVKDRPEFDGMFELRTLRTD
jgi:hypothetical protein